jgi:5-formyltetrahydrofolate cyclo-ligase
MFKVEHALIVYMIHCQIASIRRWRNPSTGGKLWWKEELERERRPLSLDERDIAKQKGMLRLSMTSRRDRLTPEDRRQASAAACGHAASWLASIGANSFLAYASFRSELDTETLLEWGWAQDIAVLLPKCDKADRTMAIYRVRNRDELTRGAYGLPEPDAAAAELWTNLEGIGAVLVPGLAFDSDGGRLGYGGGYYDRFRAAAVGNSAPWMGLCFSLQVAHARLPAEDHDVRLDGFITEAGIHYTT